MAIINNNERATLREAGRRLATVLDKVIAEVRPSVIEHELDVYAEKLIREGGDVPAFLHYQPDGATHPYPATLCVSVNHNVVHGIPVDQPLKEGDIVSLDIGLVHEGLIVDMAKTVPVGKISHEDQKLLDATKEALTRAIAAAQVGNHVGDIGHAVESYAESQGYRIVEELGGHGVGRHVHEEPFIANYGQPGTGAELVENMVIALEPILNRGSGEIDLLSDGYTIATKDKKNSAHFEHTILLTKEGPEIMTLP